MNSTQKSMTVQLFFLSVDEAGEVFASITLIPLGVFGIISNVFTMILLASSKKLKSTFYCILMSLCVSDLLSALISPLSWYRLTLGQEYWYWPEFFCKLHWAVDSTTSFATSLHIVMFAFLRFLAVQWPLRFSTFSLNKIKIVIVLVWVIAIGTGFFPRFWMVGVNKRERKLGSRDINWGSCGIAVQTLPYLLIYTSVTYPIFFYIPIILVTALSFVICSNLLFMRKKRKQLIATNISKSARLQESLRQSKEFYIMIQLCLIVGSFLVGYVPRTAFYFYGMLRHATPESRLGSWWFSFLASLSLRISECLNPIFYNVSSCEMKKEAKASFEQCYNRIRRKKEQLLGLISTSSNV